MKVFGKKNEGHLTQIVVCKDDDLAKIKQCKSQGFEVLATGKPDDYTVKDGWLEFNTNDMVITIKTRRQNNT